MARLSQAHATSQTARKGHTRKSNKETQQPRATQVSASPTEDVARAPLPQSKFKSLLDRLGPESACRYHTSLGQLQLDYEVSSNVVGSGCSGDVLLAWSRKDSTSMFAVKTIQFKNLSTLDDWHLLEVELEILLCTDSPSVVSVCDVYETECCMHIVLPYMAGGQLEPAIKSELDVLEAARQMISGVKYLHDRGIVHRDIKLDNFVWESPGDNLSIIDFGLGAFWAPNDKKLQLPCGTTGYMSPEMRTGKGYTSKTDIWSLGISILQLLVGEIPSCFEDAVPPSQQEVDAQIARADSGNDNLAQHFLAFLLKVDPRARPTAEEALQHPWFTCCDTQSTASEFSDESERDSDIDSMLSEWDLSLLRSNEDPPGSRWADLFDDDEENKSVLS